MYISQSHPIVQVHVGIHPPPPGGQDDYDRCKNITLPQASFAGGKNAYEVIFEQFYCVQGRSLRNLPKNNPFEIQLLNTHNWSGRSRKK